MLLLPGWQNSGTAHWQSLWEAQHGFTRVQQADWLWPRRGDWMARLDEVMQADERPAVLVAHSLGCQLVAAWAAHSQHTHRVRGALLVAPPDIERDDMPPNLHGWRPIVRARLEVVRLGLKSKIDGDQANVDLGVAEQKLKVQEATVATTDAIAARLAKVKIETGGSAAGAGAYRCRGWSRRSGPAGRR